MVVNGWLLVVSLCFLLMSHISSETECPFAPTIPEDRRTNKSFVRIMQYNVEWFFLDYYAPMNCYGDGCTWHSYDDAITHMYYIAETINRVKPDIVNFCEVEGCDELMELSGQLNLPYKAYLKKGTDTGTGQNVGMLTLIDPLIDLYRSEVKVAYPLPDTHCGTTTASGSTGVSKHYITEYKVGDTNVAFIGTHLLAIPTEPARCVQREAQAQVIQNVIASYVAKNYEVIVIGDMNDFDAEVLDLNSNKPTSRTLDILKGLIGDKSGTYNLTSVATRIPQSERYSDWWDSDNNCATSSVKDYSMIDHILVTPKIYDRIINAYIYHGYNEYCGKWDSDHFPVVVEIET